MLCLWVDDDPERDEEGWVIRRTVDEAIELLKREQFDIVSLDHDLQDFHQEPYPKEYNGYDIVKWMCETQTFPRLVNVHSFNPVGAKRMVEDLCRYAPPSVVVLKWEFGSFRLEDLRKELYELT